jgi:hypothetical protein
MCDLLRRLWAATVRRLAGLHRRRACEVPPADLSWPELSGLLLTGRGYGFAGTAHITRDARAAGVNVVAWSAERGALLAAAVDYRDRFPALLKLLSSEALARLARRGAAVELHCWGRTGHGFACETHALSPGDWSTDAPEG